MGKIRISKNGNLVFFNLFLSIFNLFGRIYNSSFHGMK